MLPGEDQPQFAYIGLVDDYNGVQIEQSSDFVSYIDLVLKTHSWDKSSPHEATSDHKAILLSF